MGIKEFIEEMNKKSRFKWEHLKTIPISDIGFCYEMKALNDCGFYFHYQVSLEALESLPFEKIRLHFETDMIEHEQIWLYKLYEKMTPSMKKAIVDIMKTVNGEEIDDRTNDIQ